MSGDKFDKNNTGKGQKRCTTSIDDSTIKIVCLQGKRMSCTAIGGDTSDAGVPVSSKTIRRRFADVCVLHFSDDAIRRYTETYNEKTGEKICVSLKRYRLQNFAVSTIFTDFPTYLFNSGNPTRECPEKRLQRLENEHLQRSIQASIISKEEFEKKKSFTSFPELVKCLNAEELQDIWTVICKNDLVIIMMLDTIISPVIKSSVIINKDLDLTIHIGQTKIDQL
ncbi:THAP-type domain-containing protein, partial [Trichonephila clavipes]